MAKKKKNKKKTTSKIVRLIIYSILTALLLTVAILRIWNFYTRKGKKTSHNTILAPSSRFHSGDYIFEQSNSRVKPIQLSV